MWLGEQRGTLAVEPQLCERTHAGAHRTKQGCKGARCSRRSSQQHFAHARWGTAQRPRRRGARRFMPATVRSIVSRSFFFSSSSTLRPTLQAFRISRRHCGSSFFGTTTRLPRAVNVTCAGAGRWEQHACVSEQAAMGEKQAGAVSTRVQLYEHCDASAQARQPPAHSAAMAEGLCSRSAAGASLLCTNGGAQEQQVHKSAKVERARPQATWCALQETAITQ